METKSSIRKKILKIRNAMPISEREEKSIMITQSVLSLLQVKQADYVLCYAGYNSEVQTQKLIKELLVLDKPVYLPRVSGDEMDFYRINSCADLTEGYKQIPEPSDVCTDRFTRDLWEKAKERVVMLLPGAAFSENGARIGYGKGYYDRYLKRIPCNERIGLCFEGQIVENISADAHDVPVTTIVTEEKIRHLLRKEESKHIYI